MSKFFKAFSQNFVVFYAVMAEASANMYRVNKLLEIETADWQRQLERAVGGSFLLARSRFLFSLSLVPHGNQCPCAVGSLSMYEASCVLHRYEKRTGKTVSLGDLESGSL